MRSGRVAWLCASSPSSSVPTPATTGGRRWHDNQGYSKGLGISRERALLQDPAVAVRIAEEDKRVPLSTSPLNPRTAFHVLDRAGLHTPLDQLRAGGLDVGDDELQALQLPWRHVQDPAAQVDRAARPWRCELHEAHLVADLGVEVDDEADLLAVEVLRPVHVLDGDRHNFELPVHGAPSISVVTVFSYSQSPRTSAPAASSVSLRRRYSSTRTIRPSGSRNVKTWKIWPPSGTLPISCSWVLRIPSITRTSVAINSSASTPCSSRCCSRSISIASSRFSQMKPSRTPCQKPSGSSRRSTVAKSWRRRASSQSARMVLMFSSGVFMLPPLLGVYGTRSFKHARCRAHEHRHRTDYTR